MTRVATSGAMDRKQLAVLAACTLLTINACWMVFDGSRALLLGDYVTPAAGPYAGELGPWADVMRAIGIDRVLRP